MGYLNVVPVSPLRSVDELGRAESTSVVDFVPVRPSSLSSCLSTSSAAGGLIGRDLRNSDDTDSSVGAGIGRSAERNSTGPPILSICAKAGYATTLSQRQPAPARRTIQCMSYHRRFWNGWRLVRPLDFHRPFPERMGKTKSALCDLTRVARICRLN